VFVLRPQQCDAAKLRQPDGEVLGVVLGFCPRDADRVAAISSCVRRAVQQSGLDAGQIRLAAIGGGDGAETDATSWRAIGEALGHSQVEHLRVDDVSGDNPTGASALELAAILALHRHDARRDGQGSILVAQSPEGAVGAAVVRGWSRGPDCG
jgi:3-oxoacyl-[acyl-carrier-protein] synthase II